MHGVGKSCTFIVAGVMSEHLLDVLITEKKNVESLQSYWGILSPCCEFQLLACAMQDYQNYDGTKVQWGEFEYLWEVIADLQLMFRPFLRVDDAWKIDYHVDMPMIHFAFACGLQRTFATLGPKKWSYSNLSDDTDLSVHWR